MVINKKTFAVLILVAFFILLAVFYFWSNHYVMPDGYLITDDIWQEKGLAPAEMADGTEKHPYDLIVWGTDPEGIAAAIAAARNGLNTLLIDYRAQIGGLFTLGQLNFIDMNYDQNKNLVTKGIFEEFYTKVGGMVFDIEKGQKVFEEMLNEETLLTVKLNYNLIRPNINDGKINSIKVEKGIEMEDIHGRMFIDASQDADLAYLAGVPFTEGFEDIGLPDKRQAATLVFTVEKINWYRVIWETIFVDRRASSKATFRAAWGYDNYIRKYISENERIYFRGFNMAKQEDGKVLINGLLIYGVDGADPESKQEGREIAVQEAYRFIEFANKNLPGFQKARITAFAPELYIRHTRHMQGLYRITLDDVLENRDHWDRIAYGGYPVDIQAVDQHFPGIAIGEPSKYAIPFRSLVPPNIENLLVVGRSFSSDSLAHGSTRIVPIGMSAAQAAGVAATYALTTQLNFHEIADDEEAINFIRNILELQGAYVAASECEPPIEVHHEYYKAMSELRSLGIVVGGYKNDYKLDETLSCQAFLNLLFQGTIRKLNLSGKQELADRMYYVIYQGEDEFVDKENIREIFEQFFRLNRHLPATFSGEIAEFTDALTEGATGTDGYTRGELYQIISDYLKVISE